MSNVSIFEKKWIDLVFEGRNKSYGAYQLRRENSKTTLFAFLFGISFLTVLVFTLSSFSGTSTVPDNEVYGTEIKLAGGFKPPLKGEVKELLPLLKKTEIKDDLKKEDPKNLTVAKNNEEFSDVKNNEEAKNNTSTETNSGGGTATTTTSSGVSGVSGGNGSGGGETLPPNNTVVLNGMLDVQPEYPGGIKKFYDYVGKNFEKPDIDNIESVSVLVSFVIEKDGSISDIKVLRNPGYGLDNEAVRVLKSLKTKWKPGVKSGQYVRTQYTLPIRIQVGQ